MTEGNDTQIVAARLNPNASCTATEIGDLGLATEIACEMTCTDATNETIITDHDQLMPSNVSR